MSASTLIELMDNAAGVPLVVSTQTELVLNWTVREKPLYYLTRQTLCVCGITNATLGLKSTNIS